MYRILFVFGLLCAVGFGLEKGFSKDDFSFKLESSKNFSAGENSFSFSVLKDGKNVGDLSDLRLEFFMPEMPGMPKMTQKSNITKNGDKYSGVVNFPHGGTWQIKVYFSFEGKKYQAKSSIDF